MKHQNRSRVALILFMLALVAIIALCSTALATPTPELPTPNVPVVVQDAATPLVVALAIKYPSIATALLVMGIMRLCVKPVIAAVEAYVSATPSRADDEALIKFRAGPIWRWTVFILDWLGSIKLPKSNTNPLT